MSDRRCPRAWEAEAVEDGQLAGAERTSFERHLTVCSECSREMDELVSLRELMRGVAPPDPTPLEIRRMRVGLLQKAHAKRTPVGVRMCYAWAMTAVFAVAAIFGIARHVGAFRAERALALAPMASSTGPVVFDVVNVARAMVTSRADGPVTRAVLSDGVAAFHVEHLVSGQRFLVGLPDGEIEVRGTRFVVEVRDGRTQSVDVSEGVVLLRLRGDAERRLLAGEQWKGSPPALDGPANSVAERTQRDAPLAAEPHPIVRSKSPRATSGSSATAAAPEAPVGTSRSDARALANHRFAAAVAAFRSGGYAEADKLLASFARDFSGDARSEDASFLRAVARARMSDFAGAASLARQYLRDFPGGFRRREAENLALGAGDVSVQ